VKGVFWSLLATLVGTAMLVVGIVGVAGAFDSDKSSGSSSADVPCDAPDSRFREFTAVELSGDGGSGTAVATCEGDEMQLSFISDTATVDEPTTIALWLYNNRRDAELVGSTQRGPEDSFVGASGPLPADSSDYKKIVVTSGPPLTGLEEPEKPGDVILKGRP
jgi:hypothetical protein